MSQHTPGPWKVDEFGYINASGQQIADVHVYDSKDCMDCGQCERHSVRNEPKLPYQANARLMAAAPEMYDVLKSIYPMIGQKGRAIIDKIEGDE
jgi:hypothetical protein